jgi:ABC-type multidrug transport system ATPase subunit
MTKVHLKNVSIGYSPDNVLVNNIALEARIGDFVTIAGENGIGKTTLLKTLAGIQPALAGEVSFIEKEIIGFAGSDNPRFFANMTGREIISFFELVNSSIVDPSVLKIKLVQTIKEKKIESMSSGMKQLLKLVISSLENKTIVIWDEPLRGLADNARNEVFEFAEAISSKKIMIIAEHSFSNWGSLSKQNFLIQSKTWIPS